ncbi:MAG: hypothetical protein MUO62_01580, partial [Anaerolineales bacterium]|nr:hypothetical protein [Anaerolineales bacterium]
MSQFTQIKEVKDRHAQEILAKPNVIGVGIGYKQTAGQKTGELSLVTLVRTKLPTAALTAETMVPAMIDSVVTDVMEVGEIRANQARTDRWRPAPGG